MFVRKKGESVRKEGDNKTTESVGKKGRRELNVCKKKVETTERCGKKVEGTESV